MVLGLVHAKNTPPRFARYPGLGDVATKVYGPSAR